MPRCPNGLQQDAKCTLHVLSEIAFRLARCLGAIRFADHELETGPGFIHGADLHVNEPQGQRHFANRVLGDIGGNSR